MKNIKESYKKLSEKHNLPSFEELDNEFELLYTREIFEISHPLSFVRRRMFDKISSISGTIHEILQPNPSSIVGLQESSFFSKEEKKENLTNLFKELMVLLRSTASLEIELTEEGEAESIRETLKKWKEIKPQLIKIAAKLRDGWKKETTSTKKDHNYFG
jgi:hypothetical protein